MLNKYLQLKKELIDASESYYYSSNEPIMTDAQYDQKFLELQAIEKEHPEWVAPDSPTQSPGVSIKKQTKFNTAKHSHPMLSLKTETDYSEQGAVAFDVRIKVALDMVNVDYYVEPKFDGLGLDLKYVKGKLVQALTRGDGEYGEDLTANAMMISDIPKTLKQYDDYKSPPELLIVRGEVLMFKEVFVELNRQKVLNDEKEYSNTRNAAAGAMRQLDPLKTKERKLNFYTYQLVEIKGYCEDLPTHNHQLNLLNELGLPICRDNSFIYNLDQLIKYHDSVNKFRASLPYDIDGVVYKVNDLKLQKKLGFSGREPKWAVAHKFAAEEKITRLLAIDIQVGRTGKLTPVARLQPVFVGGVIVTNVTLHNENEIIKKDLNIGDMVIVRRAGDVIPEIVGVASSDNTSKKIPFKMPDHCPVCNSPTFREEGEVDYRCIGTLVCSAQKKYTILHFIQKGAVEIKGVGESLIDQLLEKGCIYNIADLYNLGLMSINNTLSVSNYEDLIKTLPLTKKHQLALDTLMKLDRMGSKNAENIYRSIHESKHTTLKKFIYGLGIRHAGEGTAKRLVEHYGSLEKIMSATKDDLMSVKDIGPIVGTSVYNFFNDPANINVIKLLKLSGIYWDDEIKNIAPNEYCGLNIVLTGTFSTMSREIVKAKLEVLGANITGSVGKSTNLVIAGPGAGSKLTNALKLGIRIINESELIESLKDLTFHHF